MYLKACIHSYSFMSSWKGATTQRKPSTMPYDAVICCIALDEEPYIDEWIDYHLHIGFSHIYIYDNSPTHVLRSKTTSRVTVVPFPGSSKQLIAYNVFVQTYKRKHMWAAFIDCDEFIVLKKHSSIVDLLHEYRDCQALALQWRMFGTSHEVSYRDEPVTKRFHYCSKDVHPLFKSICKMTFIENYNNPHKPSLLSGQLYDTNRHVIPLNDFANPNGPVDVACIHHYYTKSEEEFRKKINRGKADMEEKRSEDELIDIHHQNNDVLNLDAWNVVKKWRE